MDEPPLPQLIPFYPVATSPIGYCRLHGRNLSWFNVPSSVRYDYLYSADELRSFLAPLQRIAALSESVYIFFNNCHAGSAVKNALMLVAMLARENPL